MLGTWYPSLPDSAPVPVRGRGTQRMKPLRGKKAHLSQAQDPGPWTLDQPPSPSSWKWGLLTKVSKVT